MTATLRVLHVVVAGELGGAERMLADLAAAGGMPGIEHAVALLPASPKLEPFFRGAGLSVFAHPVRSEGPLEYMRDALSEPPVAWLRGVIQRADATLLHLHTVGSQVLGTRAALQCRIPVLRTEHSSRAFDDITAWPFSRWSLQRVDASVAISHHIADVVRARAPWASFKLRTIANGVDADHFAYSAPRARSAQTPFRFVLCGRLEPRKGIDIALEAMAQMQPNTELCIVGEGPLRTQMQHQAAARNLGQRVQFLGYQSDVRPYIAAADAVLCSSRKEGLGLAVLEAMAMGRPAVSVPVGGVPEFVDSDTGMLATDCTADALADAMRQLMSRHDLGAKGELARARVVEHYSLQAMRRGYAALYRELTARS